MAENLFKDIRCPQYVDFREGIDSNSDSPFFDCKEYQTPGRNQMEKAVLAPSENVEPEPRLSNIAPSENVEPEPRPSNIESVAGLTEDDENKLMNKMTAALSFIESTPQLKKTAPREKLFSTSKAPFNPNIRPSTRVGNAQMLPTRIRSKTVIARLDNIISGKAKKETHFKRIRSSSMNDLRHLKKHTLPKTPLCLKRTIDAKAKAKALKTTEEKELEKVAELQKQLSTMLRKNEMAYRKLNSKQKLAPCKTAEPKHEPSREAPSKSVVPKPGPSNIGNAELNVDKNSRSEFKPMRHIAIKTVLKLDSIINGNAIKGTSNKALTASVSSSKDLERSKLSSLSSSIMSEDNAKTLPLVRKKSANIGFHSGVYFCNNNKKSTVPKPFSFELRKKQKLPSSENDENSEVFLSNSELNKNGINDKENIPTLDAKSAIKVQNIPYMKSPTPKKTLGRSNRNAIRGGVFCPLSEKTNRN